MDNGSLLTTLLLGPALLGVLAALPVLAFVVVLVVRLAQHVLGLGVSALWRGVLRRRRTTHTRPKCGR